MMDCKGCKTKRDTKPFRTTNKCIIQTNAPKRHCPCGNCIVKPMCKNECELFHNLIVSIFRMSISYDYKSVDIMRPSDYYSMERPYYRRT